MRALAGTLIVIEALVCFGPLLLLLLLGLLFTPFWITALTFDAPTAEPVPLWDHLYPLVLVVFGLTGLVGVVLVVAQIVSGTRWLSVLTKMLSAFGILAVLILNQPLIPSILSGEMTIDDIWTLLIYFLLPLGCSIHLLWLLSRKPVSTRT